MLELRRLHTLLKRGADNLLEAPATGMAARDARICCGFARESRGRPASRAASSVRGRFLAACTGASSIAPADALLTVGERLHVFLALTRTPSTPRKSADRRSAPRFCGSVTSSSASHTGAAVDEEASG